MPLVPPLESPVAATVVGMPEVMFKDSTHPVADPPRAQFAVIPTKSQSVLCPEL
jgi:hypothetical protein